MSNYILGAIFALGGIMLVIMGYRICEEDHIGLSELRDNGYTVIRHEERHGDSHTNWVEVIRTDGRPL